MLHKKVLLIMLVMLLALAPLPQSAHAQDGGEESGLPATYDDFMTALNEAVANDTLDEFWQMVKDSGQMPIIFLNRVVFMHEAEADRVAWLSGFTGLAPFGGETFYRPLEGARLGDSNIWLAEAILPYDSRFNYNLLVDGEVILADPLAPKQQLEGAGYYSTFWLPGYIYPETTVPREDIDKGTLSEDITLSSPNLERDVNVRIYTPAGYDELQALPVIYVTDGNDYWNPEMGALVTVLDNLIADGLIEPVMAAFIDQRDIETDENLRFDELGSSDPYAAFLTEELIPYVDENYKTDPSREARTILGTSLGGAMALHVGLNYTDYFGNLMVQSPFLTFAPQIVEGYRALEEPLPLNVFMNQGTFDLDMPNTRAMRDIFTEDGYPFLYIETNNEHGWSNWPALLDEMLIYFFGSEGAEAVVPPVSDIEE